MGATINQLTNRDLFEFKIPLPQEPEQKVIARVLSDTNALIQTLENSMNLELVQILNIGERQLRQPSFPHPQHLTGKVLLRKL